MLSRFQPLDSWLRAQDPRLLASCAAAVVVLLVGIWWFFRSRRPSSDELERRRRERLAKWGRITDGSLLDARTLDNEESSSASPEVLVYRYRIAGVVYECAQDVSRLPEQVRSCHVGAAVQVRYDPRHPGDSIVLAESWSGLWLPTRIGSDPVVDPVRPSLSGSNEAQLHFANQNELQQSDILCSANEPTRINPQARHPQTPERSAARPR